MNDEACLRMKELALQEFQGWADNYDRSILQKMLFIPSYRIMLERVTDRVAPESGRYSLLDIGCGTGGFSELLHHCPIDVHSIGLDMAFNMVNLASQKAVDRSFEESAAFLCGDSEHLPFPDDSFDFVTCANSFHHYPRQAEVISEFHRVLKDGGWLFVIDGDRDHPVGYVVFDIFVEYIEKQVHHCSKREMRTMFSESGFQRLDQTSQRIFPPILCTGGVAVKN